MSISLLHPQINILTTNNPKIKSKDRKENRERVASIITDPFNKFKIFLISSRKDKNKWKIPGGGMEVGETVAQTALRETVEEAGVYGIVQNYIGNYENKKKKTYTHVVSMACTQINNEWEENTRNRRWFNLYKAFDVLDIDDRIVLYDYVSSLGNVGP